VWCREQIGNNNIIIGVEAVDVDYLVVSSNLKCVLTFWSILVEGVCHHHSTPKPYRVVKVRAFSATGAEAKQFRNFLSRVGFKVIPLPLERARFSDTATLARLLASLDCTVVELVLGSLAGNRTGRHVSAKICDIQLASVFSEVYFFSFCV